MPGQRVRRLGGATVALIAFSSTALILWVPSADAQETSIEISLRTVVEAPEGSEEVLATEQVPSELVGETCSVTAQSDNNRSVHPGSNLVVGSNGNQVVLEDVEREPNAVTGAAGSLSLGDQVTVTLVMGPDEIFSAGLTVRIVCVEETTTTTEETTSTSETTTTTEETTSTSETTTTMEESTTTVGEEQEDTTTTTQVLGTTLTSTTSPPTTDGDTTTSEVAGTDSTLPFTGFGGGGAAVAGLVALGAGMGLVWIARPRRAHLRR